MKTFLKWTGLIAMAGTAAAISYRAIQAGRRRLDEGLRRAEAVTDKTRAALEEAQGAIRATRSTL
jgi:hypothetical protein